MAMWLAEVLTPAGKSSQQLKIFLPSSVMEARLWIPKLGWNRGSPRNGPTELCPANRQPEGASLESCCSASSAHGSARI